MNRPNHKLRQAIIDGYAAGESSKAIAERAGSTPGSVKVLAHKLGLTRKPVKAARDARIREMRAEGVKLIAIAAEVGLSESRVHQIAKQ